MQYRGLFITGTDTGVGKTVVASALAKSLTESGETVRARKPIESGCPVHLGRLFPEDASALRSAVGNIEPLENICAWPLEMPISPERAASIAGIQISLQEIIKVCYLNVAQEDFLLVEGAGGFLSPLAPRVRNAELAVALGLPVLLVVLDRLGCISHALLTVEAILSRGLHITAIVLNRATTLNGMNNAVDISRWFGEEVICLPESTTTNLEVPSALLEKVLKAQSVAHLP
ncbi:ATP-dependent dethiobiotin synthetase BioD [Gammaproteobacteria bacterium]